MRNEDRTWVSVQRLKQVGCEWSCSLCRCAGPRELYGDTKGTHTMLWLALADFDNSAVSNEEVDAKLDAWEEQSARIRKEARWLQREVAAET